MTIRVSEQLLCSSVMVQTLRWADDPLVGQWPG